MTNIKEVLSGVVDVQLGTIQKLNEVRDSLSGYQTKQQIAILSATLQKSKIYNGSVSDGTYTANYQLGDAHNILVSGATQLYVSNVPLGCSLSVRIINNGPNTVTFGQMTEIISTAGTFLVPFINLGGESELIGGAIQLLRCN